ncbi:Chitinase II [Penicillium frequentans]|uniref:Chitinase II n=1 Tax=Penicillium frequentans TaxID=3151616 RepID=A0AAD6CTZ5_9EURO|nr:Chitinase II [Penicillium glabrum]
MALYNTCEWSEWPTCASRTCSGAKDTVLVNSEWGTGASVCYNGGRDYCCDTSKKNKKFENCDWHDGSDLNGCPDGQMRVASSSSSRCLSSGASSYYCDGTDYTETEHLSDDLQKFEDELSNWLTNAVCELHLKKRSGGLEKREDLCEIVAKHSLVIKLAAIFASYLNLSGRTSHYNRLINIWNMGYEDTTRRILQLPQGYDNMIADSKDTIFCTLDLCEYRDGMCDQDESDLDLKRRQDIWTEKNNVLKLLGKRAKAKQESADCEDKDSSVKKIKYTRFAYPGSSKWPATSIQVREAVGLVNSESCTNTEVEEREATTEDRAPGPGNSSPEVNTEHLIEIQLMGIFMQWAVTEGNCGIDYNFFLDFFTQDVIKNAPRTPGSSQNLKKPVDRVMEQFKSKSNKEVFRLLKQSINAIKGDLWNLNDAPGRRGSWPELV